jgi:hypothetical protein
MVHTAQGKEPEKTEDTLRKQKTQGESVFFEQTRLMCKKKALGDPSTRKKSTPQRAF